jgi:hypothetical protein
MKLSKSAVQVADSPTPVLNNKARQLREGGEAVIALGIREPGNRRPIGDRKNIRDWL